MHMGSLRRAWLALVFVAGAASADTLPLPGNLVDFNSPAGERYLIEAGAEVTGVDSAPALLDICRAKFPAQEWLHGDMRTLRLDRTFGAILAWHSLFHLTPADQLRVLPNFRAHARAGAALMFTSGPAHGARIGEWHGEPLYHGSLSPDEYRALLDANGFDLVEMWLQDPKCGHATIWLARAR